MVRADAPARVRGRLTGRYVDFTSAQRAALAMLAETTRARLGRDDEEEILDAMRRLPPHADAARRSTGCATPGSRSPRSPTRRWTWRATSSRRRPREPLPRDPLRGPGAGAQAAARALPPRRPHLRRASRRGPARRRARLGRVGCPRGGLRSGLRAPAGKVPSPLGPQPDITGDGLLEVAERIVAADAPAGR